MEQLKYKQKFQRFPSRYHLYKFLGEVCERFDFKKSAALAPYCFCDTDGNFHRCPTFLHFLNTINADFGGYWNIKASRQLGQSILLIEDENPEILKGIKSVIVGKPVQPSTPIIEEDLQEEDSSNVEVDWDLIEKMSKKGTKVAKAELAEYCTPFGIDLKKNESFDNMLAKFKEHLNKGE